MPIDVTFETPPTPPSSADKTNFRTRYDAFLLFLANLGLKLISFVLQINILEANVVASAEAAIAAANYEGDWTARGYALGVSVTFSGTTYACKLAHATAQTPTNTTYWTPTGISHLIHATTAENPGDTDEFGYWDSFTLSLRKVTFLNLYEQFQARAKTYFDAIYVSTPTVQTYIPVVTGDVAGVGTYTLQVGTYVKTGNLVNFTASVGWSAHTGTGGLRISLPPFLPKAGNYKFALSVLTDGLTIPASILSAHAQSGQSIVWLACSVSNTFPTYVAMDASVTSVTISGSYITD